MPTITELPLVSSINYTDEFPIWQAHATKKTTITEIFSACLVDTTINANGNVFYVSPLGGTSTAANGAALHTSYWGAGQVTTADGNKRGKYYNNINTAPSTLGAHGSIDTAFNGDLSRSQFQIEHRITGAATLGQPTTGYVYTPETAAVYTYLFNTSGWNQSTTGNDGRTAAVAHRVKVAQAGKGDAVAYNASVTVSGDNTGTSFLANAAGVLFNGDMGCTVDGVYMNPYEIIIKDNGHDVAGIGHVINLVRTNNTGAKSVWWQGIRLQAVGSTAPIDSMFSATGNANIGLDLSFLGLQTSGTYTQAAITLSANQRIYMNATASDSSGYSRYPSALPNTYMVYSNSINAFNFVNGGNSTLQLYSNQVITIQATSLHQGTGLDYIRVTGSNAQAPNIVSHGALGNTDVNLVFGTQNAGSVVFQTNYNTTPVTQFAVVDTPGATAYVRATGTAGTQGILEAVAVGGNGDLLLRGTGSGLVSMGTHTVKAAETFTGYITIKDAAGNLRKVMVCS